jgi:UDP-GlcNAc:undecaprenyl-phosphate/decaprenyl-phosphate GlcNAc-1-phosphate transferase
VHALAFVLALALAVALAPATLRALRAGGHVRPNFRGVELPLPLGALLPASALLALLPLALVEHLAHSEVFYRGAPAAFAYVLGVCALGLIDDLLGDVGAAGLARERFEGLGTAAPRGLRGHAGALVRGEPSTGALKAGGTAGLALFATGFSGLPTGRWLLAAVVLTLCTNALNLLDLRPGRAFKAFVVLAIALSVGAIELHTLWELGLFAGPALVAGVYDMRERAMLGDTGAGALGALVGLWLVQTLSSTGQLVALGVLLALTAYGELRSISALVERVPLLRGLDSLGRPS